MIISLPFSFVFIRSSFLYYIFSLLAILLYYMSLYYSLGSLESSHLAKWSHQFNNDLILILIDTDLSSIALRESYSIWCSATAPVTARM